MLSRLTILWLVAACGTVTTGDDVTDAGISSLPDAAAELFIEAHAEVIYLRVGESARVPFTIGGDPSAAASVVVSGAAAAAGISAESTVVAAGTSAGEITVRAAADAATGMVSLTLRASSDSAFAEVSVPISVLGVPGAIDPAFGDAGTQRLDFTSAVVAAVPQGNAVVLFSSRGGVTRMLASGEPDLSFGQRGVTTIDTSAIGLRDAEVTAVAAGIDGKFVIAGWGQVGTDSNNRDVFVVRLTGEGQIDPTLTPRVVAAAPGLQIAGSLLPKDDGTVVLLGSNSDHECGGAIIWTIDAEGNVSSPTERPELACRATLQRQAVIAQNRDGLVRLAFDLRPDRSFGNAGTAFLAGIRGALDRLDVTATADILAAGQGGESRNDYCVWRLDANGAPVPDFGTAGCATLPSDTSRLEARRALAILEQADGAILVAVAYHDFNNSGGLLYRVGSAGRADLDYGALGRVEIAGPWPTYPAPMDTALFLPDRTVLFIGGESDEVSSRRIARRYWY